MRALCIRYGLHLSRNSYCSLKVSQWDSPCIFNQESVSVLWLYDSWWDILDFDICFGWHNFHQLGTGHNPGISVFLQIAIGHFASTQVLCVTSAICVNTYVRLLSRSPKKKSLIRNKLLLWFNNNNLLYNNHSFAVLHARYLLLMSGILGVQATSIHSRHIKGCSGQAVKRSQWMSNYSSVLPTRRNEYVWTNHLRDKAI